MTRPAEHEKVVRHVIGMAVAFGLLGASPAWAYLDPGTGSYLFQMAIAGLLGAAFTFRMHVRRIVSKFKDRFSSKRS